MFLKILPVFVVVVIIFIGVEYIVGKFLESVQSHFITNFVLFTRKIQDFLSLTALQLSNGNNNLQYGA